MGTGLVLDVLRFKVERPWLEDPAQASGRCCDVSEAFAWLIPGAEVLHLLGCRVVFHSRVDGYPALDPAHYHCVVRVGDKVIDWTRRQLDPSCPVPHVQSVDELRRDWIKIGRTMEELGL